MQSILGDASILSNMSVSVPANNLAVCLWLGATRERSSLKIPANIRTRPNNAWLCLPKFAMTAWLRSSRLQAIPGQVVLTFGGLLPGAQARSLLR